MNEIHISCLFKVENECEMQVTNCVLPKRAGSMRAAAGRPHASLQPTRPHNPAISTRRRATFPRSPRPPACLVISARPMLLAHKSPSRVDHGLVRAAACMPCIFADVVLSPDAPAGLPTTRKVQEEGRRARLETNRQGSTPSGARYIERHAANPAMAYILLERNSIHRIHAEHGRIGGAYFMG